MIWDIRRACPDVLSRIWWKIEPNRPFRGDSRHKSSSFCGDTDPSSGLLLLLWIRYSCSFIGRTTIEGSQAPERDAPKMTDRTDHGMPSKA